VAVVAREAGDEGARVVSPLERQNGEVQARGPALGPLAQAGDVVGLEPQLVHVVHERLRLGGREA
jgi:hypothetical protein